MSIIKNLQKKNGHKNMDKKKARQSFERYLNGFDRENEKIKLKIVHTDGVIKCAQDICGRMQLSEEEKELAELIALLHDIGRFEQIREYDSFEPTTMDHAAYGAELLFGEKKMIRMFTESNKWDTVIYKAIAHHSDYELPDGLDSEELLQAQIIRDADKLDNCRVKLEDPVEVLLGCSAEEAGAQEISEQVWRDCLQHRSVLSAHRKTKMDYWVSYVAYFFDVYFGETCKIILENRYPEKIIERIPYTNSDTQTKMRMLYEMIEKSMKEKIKNLTNMHEKV